MSGANSAPGSPAFTVTTARASSLEGLRRRRPLASPSAAGEPKLMPDEIIDRGNPSPALSFTPAPAPGPRPAAPAPLEPPPFTVKPDLPFVVVAAPFTAVPLVGCGWLNGWPAADVEPRFFRGCCAASGSTPSMVAISG